MMQQPVLRETFSKLLQEVERCPSFEDLDTARELAVVGRVAHEVRRLTQGSSCWLHEVTQGDTHLRELIELLVKEAARSIQTTAAHLWMTGEVLPCHFVVEAVIESIERILEANRKYIAA